MSGRNNTQLEITAPALSDIEQIAAYTAEQWGEKQARLYMSQLDRSIRALADNPALGRRRLGVPEAIKGRKSGAHVVFYRVLDRPLYIMRILHQSMDHGRHIEADV